MQRGMIERVIVSVIPESIGNSVRRVSSKGLSQQNSQELLGSDGAIQ